MSKNRIVSKKALASFLSAVLLLCSLLLAVNFVYKNTNNLSEDLTFNTITVKKKVYYNDSENNLDCSVPGEYTFQINRYISTDSLSDLDYSVAVYSYALADSDFKLTIVDTEYLYSALPDDFSRYFIVSKKVDSFVVRIPVGFNVESMLQSLYNDVTLTNVPRFVFVKLVVSFVSSSKPFTFVLSLGEGSIELSDKGVIVCD